MKSKQIKFNPILSKHPAINIKIKPKSALNPPNNTRMVTIQPTQTKLENKQRELLNAKTILLQLHFIRSKLLATMQEQEKSAIVIALLGSIVRKILPNRKRIATTISHAATK